MLNNAVAVFAAPVPPVTNSYESIATVTVGGGGAGSISFSSIPSTFKHLQIRSVGKLNYANWWATIAMRFNSDTAANYSYHDLGGDGASAFAQGAANQDRMYVGWASGTTAHANTQGVMILDIFDYADTNKYKTTRSLTGIDGNGGGIVSIESNSWRSTAAVNNINLFPQNGTTFSEHSKFALYGIKG